jgi:carbonic anhydrase
MRNLLVGILDFRKRLLPDLRDTFKRLANNQVPDSLFIACSDSRVVPNLFASTNPGELFVVRNVGNLVPPCNLSRNDYPFKLSKIQPPHHETKNGNQHNNCKEINLNETSIGAAIEFSMNQLKVSDIIVCGHSGCGAMNALLGDPQKLSSMPFISQWLKYGEESRRKFTKENDLKFTTVNGTLSVNLDPSLSDVNKLSQINILQQCEHLITYPVVSKRILSGELTLHAWYFDISNADVYSYSDKKEQFIVIDEEKAQYLLEKILQDKDKDSVEKRDPNWIMGTKK